MDIKTVLASAAASLAVVTLAVPPMVTFVMLQATTPGTAETGHTNISGTAISGKVRVGTSIAGGALLRVEDASGSGGVYSKSTGNGLYSESSGAAGSLIAGQFVARSTTGRGVIGSATALTGSTRGGIFDTKSTTGVGVYGLSSALAGTGVGVYGAATAATGTAVVASNPNAGTRVELAGPNGAAYVGTGMVTKNYKSNAVNAIPIAYGYVGSNGNIRSGSGNFTVTKNGTGRYDILIEGYALLYNEVSNIVTLAQGDGECRTGSIHPKLIVFTANSSGADLDSDFQFVTFKDSGFTSLDVPHHGFSTDNEWAEKRPKEFDAWTRQRRQRVPGPQ